jgi:DNA-binding XRE family transcriptional regulator
MPSTDLLTPRQTKAARALLGWGREALAKSAGIAPRTLIDFEIGARDPNRATRAAIARAIEDAGIALLEFEGVAFMPPSSRESLEQPR